MTPGGFHSFEHRWALAEAFEFHQAIGRKRIAARTAELATELKRELSKLGNLTLHTPLDPRLSAGLVCFELAQIDAPSAVDALRRRGVLASVTPYAAQYVRLGPTIANTPEDVDGALRAIQKL